MIHARKPAAAVVLFWTAAFLYLTARAAWQATHYEYVPPSQVRTNGNAEAERWWTRHLGERGR